MKVFIKEKSFVARIAAKIMRAKGIAIVFGKTIHLWNAERADFLADKRWVRHELVHVKQFKKYGFIQFIFMYLWESVKNGYYKNKFEVEAREKENENTLLTGIDFMQ